MFEGARQREDPLPPLATSISADRFTQASTDLGYHPFPQPAAILSQPYPDLAGNQRGACLSCGVCTRCGCEVGAKASALVTHIPAAPATGRYEIRTDSDVSRVNTGPDGQATGVSYFDAAGREQAQPAAIVLLSGFPLTNVRLMLMSRSGVHHDGIGNDRGLVGKNHTYQLGGGGSQGLYPGERLNQYVGNSCVSDLIHDFNADHVDHADLDFIDGASISGGGGERNPISSVGAVPTADGKTWGASWKEALRQSWDSTVGIGTQGESLPYDDQYLDLDPTDRDRFGFPLPRLTFDWHESDDNLIRYLAPEMRQILERMEAQNIVAQDEPSPSSIGPYQRTNNTGGAIMGSDPGNSVTNKDGQAWDTPNVFVTGATLFPQNPRMNPTETVCALAYLAGDGIVNGYVKDPGKVIASS